jgi:superfamily II DNA or RNA helicase
VNRRITVPSDDLVSFATGYLPALRRTITVTVADDVELPAVSAPTLTLAVTFLPGHLAELVWGFRYHAGEDAIDIQAEPSRDDPPLRDPDAEAALVATLPAEPWAVASGPDGTRLRPHLRLHGADAARFVEDALPGLEARDDIDVTLSGERPDYRFSDSAPSVRLAVTDSGESGGDWFNLDVQVSLDGEEVAFAELFAALARHDSHLILDSGTWFSLDRPELEQLRAVIAEASLLRPRGEEGLRLRAEHAGLWEELVALGVVAEQSHAWHRAVSGLLDAEAIEPPDVPATITATLRPYQRTGFGWLTFLWRSRLGGILADDMGLGKTVQLLAAICQARLDDPGIPPVLVVAPTSVLSTWASQAAQFAPGLRVEVVERTVAKRGETLAEVRARADVVVTSYTLLRLGDDEYAAEPWGAVILDEAQFVKNRQAATYKAVRRLRARVRFAVTGTPLENSVMDLWSMLSIATPGLFPDPESFTELYRRPIERGDDPDTLARLRRRVRPVMLRRTKTEVARELPPKQEQVLSIPLAPGHRRTYDRHLAAVRKQVLGLVGDLDHNRVAILAALTRLRQLALSPALLDDTAPPTSAKIDALIELVADLKAEGHRGLVFSQFTGFLALVRNRLDAEGVAYSYLDGRTRDRERRIQHFRDGDDPLFLVSLKAGGFGLTLTEADYVFILDPWWNPAAENQAVDRTHRIGQDATVMVYRLVSEDTIEEKVVALQQRKRDLFDSVVGGGSGFGGKLTAADIRALLEQ